MLYRALGRETITVAGTAIGFTAASIPTNVEKVHVQVQDASIRVTDDGTDPVPGSHIGKVFDDHDTFWVSESKAIAAFRAIRESSTSGYLDVTYYGRPA